MTVPRPLRANKQQHACPQPQLRRSRITHLLASRRPAGGGSRPRPRPTPGKPSPSSTATTDAEAAAPVEVPSLGWMWQTGSSSSNASGDSGGASSASPSARPMPSAVATVANLYEDRIKAKKSLGQNFVTDDSVLLDIVAAAGVGPGDLVLEVGPGTGNLTKHLLARGAHVTAVEKDDTLYGRLVEEYSQVPELRLVHGDAIKVGLEDLIRSMLQQERHHTAQPAPSDALDNAPAELANAAGDADPVPSTSSSSSSLSSAVAAPSRRPRGPDPSSSPSSSSPSPGGPPEPRQPRRRVKVVANLPYNITRDLLGQLLPLGEVVGELHVMIQHEAAERLTERTPGGPEWRAANVRTLFYSKPRYRFRISRHKYDPVPGVDGALVSFALLPPPARPPVPSERAFHSLVAKAFSERRKKMRNSVQPLYSPDQVESALVGCGLSADARAQDLSLQQWVDLCWRLHRDQAAQAAALLAPPPPARQGPPSGEHGQVEEQREGDAGREEQGRRRGGGQAAGDGR